MELCARIFVEMFLGLSYSGNLEEFMYCVTHLVYADPRFSRKLNQIFVSIFTSTITKKKQ